MFLHVYISQGKLVCVSVCVSWNALAFPVSTRMHTKTISGWRTHERRPIGNRIWSLKNRDAELTERAQDP